MKVVIGRIADIITTLNSIATKVGEHDTVEYEVDNRLNILETAADDLNTEVNMTTEAAAQMDEG